MVIYIIIAFITILYYRFFTLKGRFCGKLLENQLLGTGLMCVLLTLPRSLCRAIDPGITFSPCIALNTEERSRMFHKRCLAKRCRKVQSCETLPLSGLSCFGLKRKYKKITISLASVKTNCPATEGVKYVLNIACRGYNLSAAFWCRASLCSR